MFGYDITVNGSLRDASLTVESAEVLARQMSKVNYPGRLVRVHGVDGREVIAEYRNGVRRS